MKKPIHCRSCGKLIVFLKTTKGKSMPVDAETIADSNLDVLFDPTAHISHFATCPQAREWRKEKKK